MPSCSGEKFPSEKRARKRVSTQPRLASTSSSVAAGSGQGSSSFKKEGSTSPPPAPCATPTEGEPYWRPFAIALGVPLGVLLFCGVPSPPPIPREDCSIGAPTAAANSLFAMSAPGGSSGSSSGEPAQPDSELGRRTSPPPPSPPVGPKSDERSDGELGIPRPGGRPGGRPEGRPGGRLGRPESPGESPGGTLLASSVPRPGLVLRVCERVQESSGAPHSRPPTASEPTGVLVRLLLGSRPLPSPPAAAPSPAISFS
mmetsp:Transcript_29698/g.68117  ORF Transcript_29698/g.68117 Transcript_29698/m.68117 type:complete len:257 (-) Transcript_29698:78-848(-)